MNLLQNASYVTPRGRQAIALLAIVIGLTSIKVQAAEPLVAAPAAPSIMAETQGKAQEAAPAPEQNPVQETAPIVKSEEKLAPAKPEAKAPEKTEKKLVVPKAAPKKKWNTINSADLETKAASSNEAAVRTMTVVTTAYTSDPAETDSTPFTTADGSRVRDGIVAANFLPFGTRIRIPDHFGDKVFEVHDRMNARYQQRVDIWMLTKKDAYAWGVRKVKIEILP